MHSASKPPRLPNLTVLIRTEAALFPIFGQVTQHPATDIGTWVSSEMDLEIHVTADRSQYELDIQQSGI